MNLRWIKWLYVIAALYDALLGASFLLLPGQLFAVFNVTPPGHMMYVLFPALLLLVFAVMFARIAANPVKNRELILYGIGLKISYCAVAFGYEVTEGIPFMWMPLAWADLVFLILFVFTWILLGKETQPGHSD